jgi:hypothetical protein
MLYLGRLTTKTGIFGEEPGKNDQKQGKTVVFTAADD